MATLFVRHNVTNFEAWKQEYDAFDATRKSMGVSSHGVYQAAGNPTDVTVYHEFGDLATAEAFIHSPELREAMGRAGVQGEPQIWITQRV